MLKIFGVILIVAGCGGVGFRIAANYKAEEKALRQLVEILDFMACELQYRLTPLPELCRQVANGFRRIPADVFMQLALELEAQQSPNIDCCMAISLHKCRALPAITKSELEMLGKSIGRFDLEGQLKGLEAVRQDCQRNLEALSNNRDSRLRSYQTLGLCAGAALAILLI